MKEAERTYREKLADVIVESMRNGRDPNSDPRAKALQQRLEDLSLLTSDRELVADGVGDVVYHEMGHVGHAEMPLGYGDDVLGRESMTSEALLPNAKRDARAISYYAANNAGDYLAEAFNAYLRGEQYRLTPEVQRLIEQMMQRLRR